MSKKNFENIENEIGHLGGAMDENNSSMLGKKIPHASEILGGKATLTEDEEAAKTEFLKKSSFVNTMNDPDTDSPSISGGWLPLNREEMGPRSQFYPESWEFFIRAATVQAIKNWTSIDEERIEQLNSAFNDIIKTCVKIDTHTPGRPAGWRDINSWDRFWLTMKIREITFSKGEAEVKYDDYCPNCNESITYTLNSRALSYTFPDQELVDKYWNGETWVIDPAEYGVHGYNAVELYTPKLGKDDMILQWAIGKIQAGQKVDENFTKYLVWMIKKPSTVLSVFEQQVNKARKEYMSWDLDMFTFMQDVITNLSVDQSEYLKTVCPNCGEEVSGSVRFPDGIRSLFKIENKSVKKFGSRK